jgi:hypothetical protein
MENSDLLYGVPAIATFLGLRTKQARHRIAAGAIPVFRIGDTICARRSSLANWLAECEANAATSAEASAPGAR